MLTQEAEQKVLGADVVVVELPRFFLRMHDDGTGSIGEALEHPALTLPPVLLPTQRRCALASVPS